MATRLRKVRRLRGSRTHGWGQVGQHRRTGAKGGSGMAGLHKHKWSYLVKYAPDHFGRNRFRPPNSQKVKRWANVEDLGSFPRSSEGNIDLGSMGYQKLLGNGKPPGAFTVRVPIATPAAIEKIKAAGGSVIIGRGNSSSNSVKEKSDSGLVTQELALK